MRDKSSFWADGGSIHSAELDTEETQEVAALEKRLRFAWPEEAAALKRELEELRRRYRELRRSTAENLYLRGTRREDQ